MPQRVKIVWIVICFVILLGFVYLSMKSTAEEREQIIEKHKQDVQKQEEEKMVRLKVLNELNTMVKNIRELIANGKTEEAIDLAKKVLERDQDNAKAYTWWGVALVKQEKYEEALKMFYKSARLNPNQAKTYHYWGLTLAIQGKHQEAIDKYENALLLNPEDNKSYAYWGAALGQLGKHKEAAEKLEQCINLNPFNSMAYGLLVDSYFHLGEYSKAWDTVSRAEKSKITIPEGSLSRLKKASPSPKSG